MFGYPDPFLSFSPSPPSILTLSWNSYAERGKSILHLSRVASGHFWGLQMSQLHKVSSGSFWGAIERTGQRLGKDKRVKCSNGESNITCLPTGPGWILMFWTNIPEYYAQYYLFVPGCTAPQVSSKVNREKTMQRWHGKYQLFDQVGPASIFVCPIFHTW